MNLDSLAQPFRTLGASPAAADGVALCILNAHIACDASGSFAVSACPLLIFRGATPDAGQELALEAASRLVPKAEVLPGATVDAVLAAVETGTGTLLLPGLDERGLRPLVPLLAASCRKATASWRRKKQHVKTFGPKVLAVAGPVPLALASRGLVVQFHPAEGRPLPGGLGESLAPLAEQVAELARDLAGRLPPHPEVPPGRSHVLREMLEPILAIAQALGGEWVERGRRAAETFGERFPLDDDRLLLLSEIAQVLPEPRAPDDSRGPDPNAGKIASGKLVEALAFDFERPRSARWLALQLRPFGVRPRALAWAQGYKDGTRGYLIAEIKRAIEAYVPASFLRPEPGPRKRESLEPAPAEKRVPFKRKTRKHGRRLAGLAGKPAKTHGNGEAAPDDRMERIRRKVAERMKRWEPRPPWQR